MSPVKRIPLSADHGNPVGVVGNRRGAVLRGTRPSRLEARTQAGQGSRGTSAAEHDERASGRWCGVTDFSPPKPFPGRPRSVGPEKAVPVPVPLCRGGERGTTLRTRSRGTTGNDFGNGERFHAPAQYIHATAAPPGPPGSAPHAAGHEGERRTYRTVNTFRNAPYRSEIALPTQPTRAASSPAKSRKSTRADTCTTNSALRHW